MTHPPTPPAPVWQNAWLWSGTGLVACSISAGWLAAGGASSGSMESFRLALIWLGLLSTGVGVALGFRTQPGPIAVPVQGSLFILALLFLALGGAVTVVLVASWFGQYLIGARPGLALILWLLIGPLHGIAGWQCLRRFATKGAFEKCHETALILVLASVVAGLARFALSSPSLDFAQNWFTMQRFLVVMAAVALTLASLTVVDGVTRRWVVSGLVTYHLLGIVTAAVGHPPSPWIMSQIWMRIYRPYLEFMYLNNAYHFYSPEPGPPSHVWFRLYYTDAQGQKLGHWYKIPRINDAGFHGHTTSLEYQRYLSISEHTMPTDTFQVESVLFEKVAAKRLAATPGAVKQDAVVGVRRAELDVPVQLNPNYPKSMQYHLPQQQVKRLMETFARHVLHKHQVESPDRKYTSVRIYRVVHRILTIQEYNAGMVPTDPVLYAPVYMGEYDGAGNLLDPDDPVLYWQIPILRDIPTSFDSEIKDWARRHAGDPYWRRVVQAVDRVEWVDDKDKPAPPEKK